MPLCSLPALQIVQPLGPTGWVAAYYCSALDLPTGDYMNVIDQSTVFTQSAPHPTLLMHWLAVS